eukprot:6187358-Pleurochrysis_carterae.AAC.2
MTRAEFRLRDVRSAYGDSIVFVLLVHSRHRHLLTVFSCLLEGNLSITFGYLNLLSLEPAHVELLAVHT